MNIVKCASASALLLVVSVAACKSSAGVKEEAGWRFATFSGDVISVLTTEDGLAVETGDVMTTNVECTAQGIELCIRSHAFDIAVPAARPKIGQQWTVDYLTFTELREIPALSLLGQTYERVRVIRNDKRWSDGVVTSMDLYYSDEAGLLGFRTHGGELYLAAQVPSLKPPVRR